MKYLSLTNRRFGARLGATLSIYSFILMLLGVAFCLSNIVHSLYLVVLVFIVIFTLGLLLLDSSFLALFNTGKYTQFITSILPIIPYIMSAGIICGIVGVGLVSLDHTFAKSTKYKVLAILGVIGCAVVLVISLVTKPVQG